MKGALLRALFCEGARLRAILCGGGPPFGFNPKKKAPKTRLLSSKEKVSVKD